MILKNERGFSMIELLVTLTIIATLTATALPNYTSFKSRAYDAMAQSDYHNLKTVFFAELARNDSMRNFNMRNLVGPRELRTPLDTARLSADVRLVQAQHTVRPATRRLPERDIVRLIVEHDKGNVQFSYTNINGDVLEQVIRR